MAEIDGRDLADYHVLRIADERGRRANVARNCQRDQKRHGIDLFAQKRSPGNRRENVADDVVIEEGGEPAGHHHQDEQKSRGISEPRRNAASHPIIKSRQPELGGDDKKSEQQENRRPVDTGNDISGGNITENHHGDGAEQGDANAIELQSRHAPHCNPQISGDKNCQNDRLLMETRGCRGNQAGHGEIISPAVCGWIAIPSVAPCRVLDNSF